MTYGHEYDRLFQEANKAIESGEGNMPLHKTPENPADSSADKEPQKNRKGHNKTAAQQENQGVHTPTEVTTELPSKWRQSKPTLVEKFLAPLFGTNRSSRARKNS